MNQRIESCWHSYVKYGFVFAFFSLIADCVDGQDAVRRIDNLFINEGRFRGGYRLMENDARLDWYMTNIGLIAICEARAEAIREYLNLYIKVAEKKTGIIRRLEDFTKEKFIRSDSDDAYAATFISLAVKHCGVNRDRVWWKANKQFLKDAAKQILIDPRKPSGLLPIFVEGGGAAYLQDNCEVYRGLTDLADALKRENDSDALAFEQAAAAVATGIDGLYNEETKAFDQADVRGKMVFYASKTCQIFPELCRVPLGDEATTKIKYDNAWKYLNSGGHRWEIGEFGDDSTDGFPWMIIGYLAALRGEKERASAQLDFMAAELMKPNPKPQFTAINEVGAAILTSQALGQPPKTSKNKAPQTKKKVSK